jgi:16S rRNA (guanine966-N2)-methyltransferase
MRIISGAHRGRIISAPSGLPVRPTTDRAKEAIFNWLHHRYTWSELHFIDLFAGTGNMSYEAASRGCTKITAIEQHHGCCRFINSMATKLNMPIEVVQADVFTSLKRATAADVIFADPPYAHSRIAELPDLVFNSKLILPGGCFILEHPLSISLAQHPQYSEERQYGQSVFSIFEKEVNP